MQNSEAVLRSAQEDVEPAWCLTGSPLGPEYDVIVTGMNVSEPSKDEADLLHEEVDPSVVEAIRQTPHAALYEEESESSQDSQSSDTIGAPTALLKEIVSRFELSKDAESMRANLEGCIAALSPQDPILTGRAVAAWKEMVFNLESTLRQVKSDTGGDTALGTALPDLPYGALLQPFLFLMLYPVPDQEPNTAWPDLKCASARFLGHKQLYNLFPGAVVVLDRHNHRHSPTRGHETHPHFHETNFRTTKEIWTTDDTRLEEAHNTFIKAVLQWRFRNLPASFTVALGAPNKRFMKSVLEDASVSTTRLSYSIAIPEAYHVQGWSSVCDTEYERLDLATTSSIIAYVTHPSSPRYPDSQSEYHLKAAVKLDQVVNDVVKLCGGKLAAWSQDIFCRMVRPDPEARKAVWHIIWELLTREIEQSRFLSLEEIEMSGGSLMRAWVEGCMLAIDKEMHENLEHFSPLQKARWVLLERNMRTATSIQVFDGQCNAIYGDPLLGLPVIIPSAQARTLALCSFRQKSLEAQVDSNAVFGNPLTGHAVPFGFSTRSREHESPY